jgi:hypothetical protein
LATCNGQRFLREQLASYLAQTRLPDELVVCDDRSNDRTPEILAEFRASAPFPVRIQENERRLGIIKNFERVVGLCDGDVIFLSDQDDVWSPEKLTRHEDVYTADPGVGLVFSNGEVCDEALHPLGYTLFESFVAKGGLPRAMNAGSALELLVKRSQVTGCTASFRSDRRDVLIPFSEGCLHDEWIALVMSALAGVRALPEPMIRYRRHQTQAVGASRPGEAAKHGRPAELPKRLTSIDQQFEKLTEALDRLSLFEPRLLRRDYHRVIQNKLDHLRRRRSLPSLKLARLPTIFREVVSGNYYRYSQHPKLELLADLRER